MDNEFFMNGGIPLPPQLQMQYNQQPFSTTWQSLGPSIEIQTTQPHVPPPNDHFESALSSMVSSPVASTSGVSTDNFLVRELIGKLGNICNTNDFQGYLHESAYNSTNNSCYSTPLSSPPPKLVCSSLPIVDSFGLPAMPGDPGFAERAARFSSFGSTSFNSRNNGGADVVAVAAARSCSKLQRVCSSPSLNVDLGSRVVKNVNKNDNDNENENENDGDNDNEKSQMCKSRENSTISSQNQAVENGSNNRKRKGAVSKGKAPISTTGENSENSNKKRSKSEETEENKEGKEKQKVNEAPKDFIHVRARRGQATDSHSLAERVRREKISERMKLLQDLVPGCNRVTGKALMLDEIINYVQSLQRQVEFLSMKLSTVNPRLELNMDNLLTKDRIQPNCSNLTHPMYQTMVPTLYGQPHQNPLQESLTTLGSPLDPLNPTLNHSPPFQLSSFDAFPNSLSQPPPSCEGDLHNIVQMRFSQNDNGFQAPTFYGTNPAQMKIEY